MSMEPFKLSFQVSPIWLTGGLVAGPIDTMLPIIAITDYDLYQQALSFQQNQNVQVAPTSLDEAYGAFTVLPGGNLVNQTPATYPFANQVVAANATIFEPLAVSLIWDTPMRKAGWSTRYSKMTNLQSILTQHNNLGGLYTVVTPAFIYQNMILNSLTDASRGTNPIPQNAWRWDFSKPMIRLSDLANAQSALMSKLTNGTITGGQWSGSLAGVGLAPALPQFLTGILRTGAQGLLGGPGGTGDYSASPIVPQ